MRRAAAALAPGRRALSTSALKVPTVNYAEYMLRNLEVHAKDAKKVAMIDGSAPSRVTTFADLPYRVGLAARGFKALGVRKGSTVQLHLPNMPEYVVAFQALAALGASVTTSNPLYSPTELAHQLKDSGATLAVTVAPLEAALREGAKKAGLPDSAVHVLGGANTAFLLADVSAPGADRRLPEIEAVDAAKDVFMLPYSSGTTGLPKGVMLSHTNLTVNIEQCTCDTGHAMGLGPTDIVPAVLPFYHIYGATTLMGSALKQGATIITLPKFEPAQFLQTVVGHKASFLLLVPPLISFLAKHPSTANLDLSAVHTIFSGAAPLDAETQAAVKARFPHIGVFQGYGMSESSPVTHFCTKHAAKMGSVGTCVPGVSARIVDVTTGAELPSGASNIGELQIHGPNVMLGYLNNAPATRDTILPGGWLRTGDLAYRDSDGFYFVVDRLKELIKCKGLQVAPAELEGLLLQHPLLYDAAVVPRADERAGEVPVAFVVTKAALLTSMGKAEQAAALPPVTAEQVKAFVAGKVAEYKRLAEVRFVEAIPKNASGKILRRVLRDQLAAEQRAAQDKQ